MNREELFDAVIDELSLADEDVPSERRLLRDDHQNILFLLNEAVGAIGRAVSKVLEGHSVSLQRVRAKSYRILWDDGQTCAQTVVRSTGSAIYLEGKAFLLEADRVAQRLVLALATAAATRFTTAS